jgi:hypothetical protein
VTFAQITVSWLKIVLCSSNLKKRVKDKVMWIVLWVLLWEVFSDFVAKWVHQRMQGQGSDTIVSFLSQWLEVRDISSLPYFREVGSPWSLCMARVTESTLLIRVTLWLVVSGSIKFSYTVVLFNYLLSSLFSIKNYTIWMDVSQITISEQQVYSRSLKKAPVGDTAFPNCQGGIWMNFSLIFLHRTLIKSFYHS